MVTALASRIFMKKLIIALWLGILIGAIAVLTVMGVLNGRAVYDREGKSWANCREHMFVISGALFNYINTNQATNVTLETLVKAKQLPDWSALYICPGRLEITWPPTNRDSYSAQGTLLPFPIEANHSNCSYYIESLSNSFRVRCRYHTNEMNFIVRK